MNAKDFNSLSRGLKQAGKIKRGQMKASRITNFNPSDVRAIRTRLGKSQSEFSLMIGISLATLQNWEQGRRRPEGPAQALLKIASINPDAVTQALEA
jgi:putative transcriptional regulator